jgi:hypothetical protein
VRATPCGEVEELEDPRALDGAREARRGEGRGDVEQGARHGRDGDRAVRRGVDRRERAAAMDADPVAGREPIPRRDRDVDPRI